MRIVSGEKMSISLTFCDETLKVKHRQRAEWDLKWDDKDDQLKGCLQIHVSLRRHALSRCIERVALMIVNFWRKTFERDRQRPKHIVRFTVTTRVVVLSNKYLWQSNSVTKPQPNWTYIAELNQWLLLANHSNTKHWSEPSLNSTALSQKEDQITMQNIPVRT